MSVHFPANHVTPSSLHDKQCAHLALVSRIEIQDNLKLGSFLCFPGIFPAFQPSEPHAPQPKKEPTGCNYLRFPVDNEDLGKFGIRPPHLKQVVCF